MSAYVCIVYNLQTSNKSYLIVGYYTTISVIYLQFGSVKSQGLT